MVRSLLGRLVFRLILVTVFFIVLCAAALVWQFVSQVETLRDRDLTGQAADVAAHLVTTEGTDRIRLDLPDALRAEYEASGGMFVYAVLDADGNRVFSSPGVEGPLSPVSGAVDASGEAFQAKRIVAGSTGLFYGITVPVSRAGRQFFVQVAQGPGHSDVLADQFLAELWEYLGWLIATLVVVVLAVVYATVRSSLAPVTAISRQAQAITPTTLHARLGVAGLPRELSPLVDAVNNAFERIEVAYRRQREFTDNAAHEMRTPLAVLRAHVESLDSAAARAALLPDIGHLERMVEQLLRLARADNFVVDRARRADLREVAADVAAQLGPGAVAEGVTLELEAPAAPVVAAGDGDYLAIALRNIVENAINVSARGDTVTIVVEAPATISVTDRGGGIPADQRAHAFERFWRADPSATSGAGLGLSIVKRIMDAHNGTCSIEDAPGGGTVVAMHLNAEGERDAGPRGVSLP